MIWQGVNKHFTPKYLLLTMSEEYLHLIEYRCKMCNFQWKSVSFSWSNFWHMVYHYFSNMEMIQMEILQLPRLCNLRALCACTWHLLPMHSRNHSKSGNEIFLCRKDICHAILNCSVMVGIHPSTIFILEPRSDGEQLELPLHQSLPNHM